MQDICDDYGFLFLDNVETPMIRLDGIGKQSRYSKEYYWDNRNRQEMYLFQYTLNGNGTLKSSGKTYTLEKGDAFFVKMPGDEIYYFDEENNRAPWELIYILFSGPGVESYYNYITERVGKVMQLPEYHPAIRKLFDLYTKAGAGQVKNAFAADNEVFSFLCLLCANEREETGVQVELIERARKYIEDHYADDISLYSAAEYLGVSQSHLSREFAKHIGEPAVKYLTKVRLEKAAELLCSTERSLEEIGRACGFADGNYFGKVFRKYMKLSPGNFRKQMKMQGYKSIQV